MSSSPPSTSFPIFPVLVLAAISAHVLQVGAALKCPDGSDGLTQSLYESGVPSDYADVTCIPENAFKQYAGDVSLDGLSQLKSIERSAFESFKGKLRFSGSYPFLAIIGAHAFAYARNVNSKIEMVRGLPQLKSIKKQAFSTFAGILSVTGPFPLLAEIGEACFRQGTADSDVSLDGLPLLKSIERSAFESFKGKLTFSGSYPLLSIIGALAFRNVGNVKSKIEIVQGLPQLKSIKEHAFQTFAGILSVTGPFPLLAEIGVEAFECDQYNQCNAGSKIEFPGDGLPKLTEIKSMAFSGFRGTLIMKGRFPLLSKIERYAFASCTSGSEIELVGGLARKLTSIGEQAFDSFAGLLTISGPFHHLSSLGDRAFSDYNGRGSTKSTIAIACRSPSGLAVGANVLDGFRGRHIRTGEHVACGSCPDGSNGLTKELYFAGDPSQYANVTCIPASEFESYYSLFAGDVTLDGLAFLTSIEDHAFAFMKGTLTVTGSYPKLVRIGEYAFDRASYTTYDDLSSGNSTIELVGAMMPMLTAIDKYAFHSVRGTVAFTGRFPLLKTIGYKAFDSIKRSSKSKVELAHGLPALTTIGEDAFLDFAGLMTVGGDFPLLSTIAKAAFGYGQSYIGNAKSTIELVGEKMPKLSSFEKELFRTFQGTLNIHGSFPLVSRIGMQAFYSAGNAESKVELADGMPALESIDRAFSHFQGTVIFSGAFPRLAFIGERGFEDVGRSNRNAMLANNIAIACRSPSGLTVGARAFDGFRGTHHADGEQCSCAATCAPCWLSERLLDGKT